MPSTVRILTLSILVALAGAAMAKPAPAPAASATPSGAQGTTSASVYKDNVAVHQAAQPTSPTVATLKKGSPVDVQKQEGLWFNVKAQPSAEGYVKINEIRLAKAAGGSNDGYSMFGGHPKPSETAGVRGINEEQLRGATFDAAAVARMETFRVDDSAAN
ncbi:MAG TPA: SH3 domain-containing protein, partial [Xanthomonadaceae bacterium]|nr:SH3 domain-containing protein [Xanthomonadaceae bacterium]